MKKTIHSFSFLAALLLLLSVSSCIFDHYPEDEAQATIFLSIDGAKTRAGSLYTDDAEITRLRVIVFTNGVVEKNQLFTAGTPEFDNPFRIEVASGTKTVYVVANETAHLAAALSAATSESDVHNMQGDAIAAALTPPLVMSGKLDNITLTPGLHQKPVTLTRVAAKINLRFKKETTAPVVITKVTLTNNTGKTSIYPSATAPAGQTWWSHTTQAVVSLTSTTHDYLTLYVYENLGNTADNKTHATWLEVEATYDGMPSVYRAYVNENVASVVNPGDPMSSVTTPADHLYNIRRNYAYELTGTIKGLGEFQGLMITTNVEAWTGEHKTYFVGYGYTVEVDGTKVTVSNHGEDCPPHEVKLEALNGDFVGGGNERTFDQTGAGDSATYTLSAEPTSGDYLKVYYNGVYVHTFSK